MSQTIGSQIFGPWYDVVGWAVGAAIFLYLGIAGERLPENFRGALPSVLRGKTLNFFLAGLMAVCAVTKALAWW